MNRAPVLLALVVAGCGGSSTKAEAPAGKLTRAEAVRVAAAERDIRAYCRAVGRALTKQGEPPSDARAGAAVKELGALGRARPGATTPEGETVSEVMGDIVEDLEGTNCSQGLVDQLEAELRTLPPPE